MPKIISFELMHPHNTFNVPQVVKIGLLLKKITITNIWCSTKISTFAALSKWHEPDISWYNLTRPQIRLFNSLIQFTYLGLSWCFTCKPNVNPTFVMNSTFWYKLKKIVLFKSVGQTFKIRHNFLARSFDPFFSDVI